jgi:hypothetical protein
MTTDAILSRFILNVIVTNAIGQADIGQGQPLPRRQESNQATQQHQSGQHSPPSALNPVTHSL